MALKIKKNKKRKSEPDVIQQIKEMGADPLLGLAHFATGNVVALGFMSDEEYKKETVYAEIDGKEEVVITGGDLKALKLITPKMRLSATRELAQYMHAKRAHVDGNGDNKEKPPQVILYLPEQDDD